MIHYITEGGDGNKELKTRRWFLPDGIRRHLEKIKDDNKKEELSKNHTTKEAWDHLEFILDSEKGISYNEMKRIKNWFDKNFNATKTKQYELYGGKMMKTWVENQLNSATLWVKKHKEAQRAMGKENAFIKPHEADRQNTVSKVDTKVPTYNPATLNKQNRLKELGDLKEQKTVIITESQRKQLLEAISGTMRSDFFQELNTYASVEDYGDCFKLCRQYLGDPIGTGSSRVVFQVDDEKILKLAMGEQGMAQNKTEINAYKKTTKYKELFPQIFSVGYNNVYFITEYVFPLNTLADSPQGNNYMDDIYHCLGITEDDYDDLIRYIEHNVYDNEGELNIEELKLIDFKDMGVSVYDYMNKKMKQNQNLNLLMQYLLDNPNLAGESFKEPNMGMTKRNGKAWIVILDNGWDGNVAQLYKFQNFGELNV
jgi:hypothetical protein